MAIDVYLRLDDFGLFKKARKHEQLSQYDRACQIRDQFAECMTNALIRHDCDMPDKCARGDAVLVCNHLVVDYTNFTLRRDGQGGIPLTGKARRVIDARLRAIGTLVYRENGYTGPLPGDIYVPELARISSFTGTRRAPASKRVPTAKDNGLLGRLLGSLFE